jgi:F-type H+-transporting ATPase subunit delta
VLYANAGVAQVNLAATSGDMGVLANHVPSIEQLKPGVVEILGSAQGDKKYFVSSGFAIIHPDSSININAVEAFELSSFSPEAVQSSLAAATRNSTAAPTDAEKEEAKIQVEVLEALAAALKQ